MKKIIFAILILYCLSAHALTLPTEIVCGAIGSGQECYAGQKINELITIANDQGGIYPNYALPGTYVFSSARAQIKKMPETSPGIIEAIYRYKNYPQIFFFVHTDIGYYADAYAPGSGWGTGGINDASCNKPDPTNCYIIKSDNLTGLKKIVAYFVTRSYKGKNVDRFSHL